MAFTHSSWVERRQTSYEWPLDEAYVDYTTNLATGAVDETAGLVNHADVLPVISVDAIDALIRLQSVVAPTVEAVIGTVFIHSGFDRTAEAVVAAFADRVDYVLQRHVDHKTVLQEQLARRGASVTYAVTDTSGPPHQRLFTTVALVGELELGRGSGSSKKASEQAAAREALANIDRIAD